MLFGGYFEPVVSRSKCLFPQIKRPTKDNNWHNQSQFSFLSKFELLDYGVHFTTLPNYAPVQQTVDLGFALFALCIQEYSGIGD
jgi:hypothetical protein